MILTSFKDITEADLNSLLAAKTPEGKTIEYKRALPGNADDDRKEFLADVSSFANSSGGDLLFGIDAVDGIPTSIPGLVNVNADADGLRLEGMIRDGIAPRLPGVQIRNIPSSCGGPVLLIRVPRSFASPHMVVFKNYSRFYARNSKGKYQLDVGELRTAFAASESLGERIQRFRLDRVAKIIAGETPVRMPNNPKLILHLLPLVLFSVPFDTPQCTDFSGLFPIDADYIGFQRHNFDGYLTQSETDRKTGEADNYCQYFRYGGVEAVSAYFSYETDEGAYIDARYEEKLIKRLPNYIDFLRRGNISPPFVVTVSMTGVRGRQFPSSGRIRRGGSPEIDRDCLLLPDVLIQSYDGDLSQEMRPIFDAAWNAAGFAGSPSYGENGKWRTPK